jgi:hypothetical protein
MLDLVPDDPQIIVAKGWDGETEIRVQWLGKE